MKLAVICVASVDDAERVLQLPACISDCYPYPQSHVHVVAVFRGELSPQGEAELQSAGIHTSWYRTGLEVVAVNRAIRYAVERLEVDLIALWHLEEPWTAKRLTLQADRILETGCPVCVMAEPWCVTDKHVTQYMFIHPSVYPRAIMAYARMFHPKASSGSGVTIGGFDPLTIGAEHGMAYIDWLLRAWLCSNTPGDFVCQVAPDRDVTTQCFSTMPHHRQMDHDRALLWSKYRAALKRETKFRNVPVRLPLDVALEVSPLPEQRAIACSVARSLRLLGHTVTEVLFGGALPVGADVRILSHARKPGDLELQQGWLVPYSYRLVRHSDRNKWWRKPKQRGLVDMDSRVDAPVPVDSNTVVVALAEQQELRTYDAKWTNLGFMQWLADAGISRWRVDVYKASALSREELSFVEHMRGKGEIWRVITGKPTPHAAAYFVLASPKMAVRAWTWGVPLFVGSSMPGCIHGACVYVADTPKEAARQVQQLADGDLSKLSMYWANDVLGWLSAMEYDVRRVRENAVYLRKDFGL